jgi:hypothetical protein
MDQITGIYNNNNSDRKGLHTDVCKHSRLHSSFLKKINLKGRIDSVSDADIVATTDTVVTFVKLLLLLVLRLLLILLLMLLVILLILLLLTFVTSLMAKNLSSCL